MEWVVYKSEFTADGDLRKIIINNVTQKKWQKLLNFLVKTEVTLNFFTDGVRSEIPSQIERVFQKDKRQYLLSLVFDSVNVKLSFRQT